MTITDENGQRPEQDFRIVRLLAALEAIPDPVERAHQCLNVGDQVRTLQARLGEIRRRAVYEATLKPGATGRSVAAALGVSAKAVSQATSEFRQSDLAMFDRAADILVGAIDEKNPDVVPFLTARAATRVVPVLAQALLRTYPAWLDRVVDAAGDVEPELDGLGEVYERAEYLCQLAQVSSPERVRFPTLAFAQPDYDRMPAELIWPAKVLNAMPGIFAYGSEYQDAIGRTWSLGWSILPVERYTSVFDAGPDPRGWAVTEWLVWLARDFERGGFQISSRVTSPPPFLNEPGEMLTFFVEGAIGVDKSVSAAEFAEQLIRLWDGGDRNPGAGYFGIEWPPRKDVA